jgi:phosphoglycolate phosphatase-like HAD superfamily hydrolase
MGHAAPVPDWLLAAVQGARWVVPASDMFVPDLLKITKSFQPTSDDVHALLGLAAALRPALIAPFSGVLDWLRIPSCCPALHSLVTAVHTFASAGIALQPEDLLGVTGAEQRELALIDAAQAARRWLEEASGQRVQHKQASDVWRALTESGGELHELLLPVQEDHRSQVEQVRERLDPWQQPDAISSRLQQLNLQRVGRKGRAIVGAPLRQLIRDVEEACRLARHWCDLVEHARQIETRGSWVFEQVSQLRMHVQKALPHVEVTLEQLSAPHQPASLVAAAYCLRRAIRQLIATLNLTAETTAMAPLTMHTWEWCTFNAANVSLALSRRLVWFPKLLLSDDGQPVAESLSTLARVLSMDYAQERSVQTAFEGCLQQQDYRFITTLLESVHD